MNVDELQKYIFPLLIVIFFVWRFWRFKKVKKLIPGYIDRGAVLIDVRSVAEFNSGSHPLTINMPLTDLHRRLKELDKNKPIVVCCASGARSEAALRILKQNGFTEVINAGPWTNI